MALPQRARERAGLSSAYGYPDVAALEIGHALMNDALGAGTAVPLGDGLPWVARYAGMWWVHYEGGWLRVADESVCPVTDISARSLSSDLRGPFRLSKMSCHV